MTYLGAGVYHDTENNSLVILNGDGKRPTVLTNFESALEALTHDLTLSVSQYNRLCSDLY